MPQVYRDKRHLDPDWVRSQDVLKKIGEPIDLEEAAERHRDRDGNRELDAIVRGAPNLSERAKEAQTAFPLDASHPPSHERKNRRLPAPGERRTLLSSRQRKDRSKTKYAVQDEMPTAQYEAVRTLLEGDGQRWADINDALQAVAGSAMELDEPTRHLVKRLDRAIASYESRQDRGHLVYTNVEMPTHINRSNLAGYARNQFEPGALVELDRYTGATHCLHEIESAVDTDATLAFEISTTRGMYLGGSDSTWFTPHLLPRAMALYSHGTQTVEYTRPDGTVGTRTVVQLADTPPDGVKVITPIDKALKAQKLRERREQRTSKNTSTEHAAPKTTRKTS